MLNIQESYLSTTHINRPGTPLASVRSYVFHYTANVAKYADALANAIYFGRSYEWGKYYQDNLIKEGWIEKNSANPSGIGVKFAFGSTQVIADMNKIVLVIPLTEKAYSVGDGSTSLATKLFAGNQNAMTINVEICNNDAIVNSDEDWNKACMNAIEFVANDIVFRNKGFNYKDPYAFLRHYDISGKLCPAPFIDLSISAVSPKWLEFKTKLINRIEEIKLINSTPVNIPAPTPSINVVGSKYFKDVPVGHWSIPFIDKAKECGIISGKEPSILGFTEDLARTITMQVKTLDYVEKNYVKK